MLATLMKLFAGYCERLDASHCLDEPGCCLLVWATSSVLALISVTADTAAGCNCIGRMDAWLQRLMLLMAAAPG
jgi:hypothetical protein